MSEIKMISPLLDDMIVEKERIGCNGQTFRTVRKPNGEQFILKTISLPENDSRIRALILSGAYADESAVHEYYGRLAGDIKAELQIGQKLAATDFFAGAVNFQIEPKASGVGYDVYILYPMNISLTEFVSMNAMTRLRALNMGIDLCDSIATCRNSGYLFQNINPDNIHLMPSGKFLLGDLGLTSLEYLQYASVPEEYLGAYSAPELSDITACPNLTIDLYALGMVLYRIYNGNHGPFEDESTNAAMAEKLRLSGKPLPSPIYADYELAEIILKACAFKTEDRYRNPDELKQALMLYMQRNAISDDLIVPPIVAELPAVELTDEEDVTEPIRMTDASELDEDFRHNFAPDMSGSGNEAASDTEEVTDEASAIVPSEEVSAPPVPTADASDLSEESSDESAESEEPEAAEPGLAEPVEEPSDPDQIDLDTLLASVSVMVAEDAEEGQTAPQGSTEAAAEESDKVQTDLHPQDVKPDAPDAPPQHDYVDTTVDESEEESTDADEEGSKRSRGILWGSIIALLAGLALLGYFVLNWYFVDVSELKTVYTTPSQIMVELVSKDNPNYFKVTCTDFHGNTYEGLRSGNQYCFTDLHENTSYTIRVVAAGNHKFSTAAPVLKETTNEYTTISGVSFERLEGDGNIRVNFHHTGPAPEQWKITYHKKGDSSTSRTVEGREISGLELYETYVFTIEDAGGVFIAGNNIAEYQVLPEVIAKNFVIEDIVGDTVKLKWDFEGAVPEKWGLTCTADGMEDMTLTTTDTFGEFTLPDFSNTYTFHLTALGISEPQEIVLDSDTVIVANLTAQANDSGEIVVTWDTPAGEPKNGWLLTYRLNDCYYELEPAVVCTAEDENSVTLKYLPGDALCRITLLPADSADECYGTTTLEVTTPKSAPYTGNQILPATPYGDGTSNPAAIALWKEPSKENWDFRDLNSARRTTYKTDESIAFCVQINSADFSNAAQSSEVHLTYAVRNESGLIVAYKLIEYADEEKTEPLTWGRIWFERRHTGTIPTPYSSTEVDENGNPCILTGEFTVEIYINGKLLAQKDFVIES